MALFLMCVLSLWQEGVGAAGASTGVGASRGGASVPAVSTASAASMVSVLWCFVLC